MREGPSPGDVTQTEFLAEAVETTVTDEGVDTVESTLRRAVKRFRAAVVDDETAAELLCDDRVLRESDAARREEPEPLACRVFVEPMLDALGYDELAHEVGDLSDRRGDQADYAASFQPYDGVDSRQLLFEAEPLNKSLDRDRHGLGQVLDWLSYRPFEAEFGVATDGLRWVLVRYDRDTYSLDRLAGVDLRPVVRHIFAEQTGVDVAPEEWDTDDTRTTLERFVAGFELDNVVTTARDADRIVSRRRAEITDQFYDEYVAHVFGRAPGDDEHIGRSLVGDGVVAPSEATGDDVRLFAIGLVNRLVFVKFLEDRDLVESGLLEKIAAEHRESDVPRSLYETYLEPLFFGVFDERRDDRSRRIETITRYSEMPYLNGGLFRPAVNYDADVDDTAFDVVDDVLFDLLDLLERYEFSTDGGPSALDPSVLGNVFEKTINYITTDTGDQKKELGAYYTPDEITRFCAEQTVLPRLREEIGSHLRHEHGYTESMLTDADDVFDLIGSLPPQHGARRRDCRRCRRRVSGTGPRVWLWSLSHVCRE
ncbi:hypothetical protein [Halobaculum sp. MBLA0143]|uniref:hypothetical protein n=1 Tax=Halobaculum sp. MBLA0143 TaxID=3079933 RepID=UPI003523B4CD